MKHTKQLGYSMLVAGRLEEAESFSEYCLSMENTYLALKNEYQRA